MNTINAISPYRWNGLWVFDDESKGLDKEPFVMGADALIEGVVTQHELGDKFILLFSKSPFLGYMLTLERIKEQMGGNWYYCPEQMMEGWLCPALFKYFDVAPELIFVQFKKIVH